MLHSKTVEMVRSPYVSSRRPGILSPFGFDYTIARAFFCGEEGTLFNNFVIPIYLVHSFSGCMLKVHLYYTLVVLMIYDKTIEGLMFH